MIPPLVTYEADDDARSLGVIVTLPGGAFRSFPEAHMHLNALRDGLLAAESQWIRESHPHLEGL